MSPFFSNNNLSYYMVPTALVLALLPRFYSGILGPGKKFFTPRNPRGFVERLEKTEALDKKLSLRLIRAEACVANSFEGLPVFAAAVTAGNAAGMSPESLNYLSLGYIVSRVLYSWVYVFGQDDPRFSPMWRTRVWGIGQICVMTLFVKAGLRSQPRP